MGQGVSNSITGLGTAQGRTPGAPFLYVGTGWHEVGAVGEPAFENNWVNEGPLFANAAFKVDAAGNLSFRGDITAGTIGAAVFTLPAELRPQTIRRYPVACLDSFTNAVTAIVQVQPAGRVIVLEGDNNSVSLCGSVNLVE